MDFTKFNPSIFIYMLKCIVGLSLCYILYVMFPQYLFYWSVISVILSLSPEEGAGNKVAFDRIIANVVGSMVGFLLFLIYPPDLLLICIGIVLTIAISTFVKHETAPRSALTALVIVMLNEEKDPTLDLALERMLFVIAGSIVALFVTLVFSEIRKLYLKNKKN